MSTFESEPYYKNPYGGIQLEAMPEQGLEQIPGKPFRYFTFVKNPDGSFGFDNLHLPTNWQKGIPRMQEMGISKRPEFSMDPATMVLTSVQDEESDASLNLQSNGEYKLSPDIKDLNTALRLQNNASVYLSVLMHSMRGEPIPNSYPSVFKSEADTSLVYYASSNLQLPDGVLNSQNPVITQDEALAYKKDIDNMAESFGEEIEGISFDDKGILRFVTVNKPGCSCSGLEGGTDDDNYFFHNVYGGQWAAVLHNSVSIYLNLLLDKGYRLTRDIDRKW